MNITLLSGKAVVASFQQHHVEGIEGIVSLQRELLRRFKFCATLHFDADKPCYIRVLVRTDENAQALADEIAAVIREHMPLATDPSAVKTRIVTAPEFGKDDAEQMTELAALQAEVTRYKHAASALWKLLDDIDTADDAARDDDARYRGSARTLAKRRSEHAQSFDGQTLVWSWHSPLPAADFAKLEIKVLQGDATDDEVAEYKRLVLLHTPPEPELPPELLDVAAQQLNAVTHGPSPGFLERIAEAAKTATADNPAFIEVEPEKYDAADCLKLPPVEFPITSTHAAKPSVDPEVVTISQFAKFAGVSPEQVTIKDGELVVEIPQTGVVCTCPDSVDYELLRDQKILSGVVDEPGGVTEIRTAEEALKLFNYVPSCFTDPPLKPVTVEPLPTLNEAMAGIHPSLADEGEPDASAD